MFRLLVVRYCSCHKTHVGSICAHNQQSALAMKMSCTLVSYRVLLDPEASAKYQGPATKKPLAVDGAACLTPAVSLRALRNLFDGWYKRRRTRESVVYWEGNALRTIIPSGSRFREPPTKRQAMAFFISFVYSP